jgi:hypothetical protein
MRKLNTNMAANDLDIENAKADTDDKVIPAEITQRSSTLPEANEAGYDRAAYPRDKAPTSKPIS